MLRDFRWHAKNDIQNTGRQACIRQRTANGDGRCRGFFAWLDGDGTAGGQSARHLAHGIGRWKIPGNKGHHGPDWFLSGLMLHVRKA